MENYNHKKIEPKWQKRWEKERLYLIKDKVGGPPFAKASGGKKKNFYQLVEFPYPSGNLHVGHWYAFSVPDIFVRAKRMQGLNVLYPIGFDAFGLPAENAALKRGINPKKWTYDNIAYMKKQLHTMGASFDWSREVVTADPDYYKWTQWLFLQFFKKGLAYQAETNVNWCPSCKTVLANEQVHQGLCDRCGSEVEQRKMKQWLLKITDYAERLLKNLDKLNWPEEIKESQRNWIGKSEGAEIDFPVVGADTAKHIVVLHGRNGTPDNYVFPWLKQELEKRGYTVEVPRLPNTAEPNDEEQADYVEKHCKLDENTAIVAQSFGGIVAMRFLERGVKVNRVVLACVPFSGKFIDKKIRKTVTAACEKGFNFKAIKKNARQFIVLRDERDEIVPSEDAKSWQNNLGGVLLSGYGSIPHFSGDKEPDMLRAIAPTVQVFTTRPDTIYGAAYLVLAPDSPLLANIKSQITNSKEIEDYIAKSRRKTERQRLAEGRDKTGVELKGIRAINPATKKEIPIWVADYVLGSVGTGAIMAVPAHDERDYEFAKKYKLPIKKVIEPPELGAIPRSAQDIAAGYKEEIRIEAKCWTGDGTLINSGEFSGRQSNEAREAMAKKFGKAAVQYRMRDWVVSRQRYWGCPIPIIHCEMCGPSTLQQAQGGIGGEQSRTTGSGPTAVPVPEKDLPVLLPEIKDYKPRADGQSPLAKAENWVKVKCPTCGLPARRETDTLDTFIDSSWYFLRYTDPKNKKEFADSVKVKNWLPVDRYSGGAEHTTMHLLYSRFWIMAMHDLGLLPWDEPYKVRMNRGLILGPDGQKMSKSRGNVVDPDEYVEKLGTDTVRMYLAFIGPYNEVGTYPWDAKGIQGIRRFLERVWRLFQRPLPQPLPRPGEGGQRPGEVEKLLHKTIKKVTEDIEAFKFNTAIASMMSFVNEPTLRQAQGLNKEHHATFLKLLAPFAPHLTEELWQEVLGHKQSIHLEKWPKYDPGLVREETVKVIVQVDGRVRGSVEAAAAAEEAEVHEKVLADERLKQYLTGKKIRKVVYVPGKIINFVIK